jgi:cobalt-zinc-cadmium efflux system outer membrane protein
MRRAMLCAALAVALSPSKAGAQSVTLTESEALARLSPESPRVRAIRAPIEVARVDVLAASRWPNPQPSLTREAVAGVTEYLTTVSQSLPISGRREFDIEAASARVLATTSRAEDGMRRLRADLRLAFADLAAAQTRERELTAALERLRSLSDVLARREKEGDAAGFDRLRAEREVFDVESDLAAAATERSRAQIMLASFFANASDAPRLVAAPGPAADAATPIPAVDTLVQRAESTRGELIALRHEVDAARFAGRAAERRLIPEPEVVAGTKSSSVGAGDIGSVFTVRATIPLFDRGRPEHALAAAQAAQAEARLASLQLVLRAEIEAARAEVIQRRAAAGRYRAQAINSAAQIERIAQVSYDAGERGILELLDAYRVGASARVRQAALDAAVREAEIELEFTSGWEMP